MAKFFVVGALAIFLIFVTYQAFILWGRRNEVQADYRKAKEKLDRVQVETDRLAKEVEYYADPSNFEKELRARFNYKKIGERTLILVPNATSASE